MRAYSKKAEKKWTEALKELKYKIDNNQNIGIIEYLRGKQMTDKWSVFLHKNKIIIPLNRKKGQYKWNEKIPVSYKLISKFRQFESDYLIKINRKKSNLNQTNLFDMPSSATPPRPKVRKTRTPKVEVQVNNDLKSELGVIRKFLKWLW